MRRTMVRVHRDFYAHDRPNERDDSSTKTIVIFLPFIEDYYILQIKYYPLNDKQIFAILLPYTNRGCRMLKGSKAEILKQIGDGLRMRRLFLNLTREIAAERSGISASTVKNIENGHGGSIWALVSLCRTYGHANWVYELAPEEQIDHHIAQITHKERKRASRRSPKGNEVPHV